MNGEMTRTRPGALKRGDVVAVVAPAAAVERQYLERGVAVLNGLGFRVRISKRALERDRILAGTDRVRADELQGFFADPEVRAIFAARGGYGCGRLLPLLDFNMIAHNPKIFVGFSDASFILGALVRLGGLVCFHGPMVAMDFARGLSEASLGHLRALLSGELDGFELEARETLRSGSAGGELVGGCLSVLVATIGTPYQLDFRGRILFLEDTGEKAYRIDRMLVQMRQAGILGQVKGIVFGGLRPVDDSEQERNLIRDFVAEATAGLDGPVLFGIEAGHGTENFTIPLGVHAWLDGARRRLVVAQAAVSPR